MAVNPEKIFSLVMRMIKQFNSTRSRTTGNKNAGTSAPHSPRSASTQRSSHGGTGTPSNYPGDFRGTINFEYAPSLDGNADPGEIVWGWVPYEEDYSQGKDRPVLIVGREGGWLLGLMLTSKDKNNESHHNPSYMDIGTGSWDRERRPSEVKLDRIIRLNDASVRREGAILDKNRFSSVVNALNERA
ncbi:type II toxin-antitoxin system PemK/MazF family toxin [Arthrobacter sp. NIO-1057]|uniref:type II toxin-antitoxin system PemK/MazF family toxin n=1 Tax=Arthrobacter sp. NIO-1057 TaxID=993071 RepID=UPI00071E4A3B|nr:type II toxin-antitoxin system PemK/MazF family toxin [Arthrobacter sp. NIO-1057]KSU67940.1 RNA 3'-terminal phosphate cyclase [Arthrobacter sp. NIO-1057]SCB83701.1 PemK-like, MazF-like toxin of type II toxin-antitoxin system [Arthrobacter sp. NIO-1057]